MKKTVRLAAYALLLCTLVSCGNSTSPQNDPEPKTSSVQTSEVQTAETQTSAEIQQNIYSFITDDDTNATYYVVDPDSRYVYMFYADENNDTCYALPIEEGDLDSGLKGSISDGYSMIPFLMRYKEGQTDRVIMTIEDAYDVELSPTDTAAALKIKEGKTVIEPAPPEEPHEISEDEIYTADGQVIHRDRIVGLEGRIDAVIKDIEMGSGETVSYERASVIEQSLDVYSDSSADIKSAYNDPDSPYRELMEALDEYLHHSVKWSGTVMRGVVASEEEKEKLISAEAPIDMFGPGSWTSDETIAQNYARDKAMGNDSLTAVVYVLDDNKSGVSITHLSRYGTSEREVLAPSGILYIVDFCETISDDSAELLYVHVHEAE